MKPIKFETLKKKLTAAGLNFDDVSYIDEHGILINALMVNHDYEGYYPTRDALTAHNTAANIAYKAGYKATSSGNYTGTLITYRDGDQPTPATAPETATAAAQPAQNAALNTPVYVNSVTGEIIPTQRAAVETLRTGVDVDLYKNGVKVLTWEHYEPEQPEPAATAAEPAPASDEPAAGPEPEQPATGYTVSRNEQFNSVEITFTSKPSDAVRDALKARGFRWHRARGLWYGYADADEITAAINAAIQSGKTPEPTPAPKKVKATKPAPVNKYGVKVGDLFRCSWGYDQTQNDFYQVVALCGSLSVRVREVCPEMIASRGISWGAEDRIYNTNTHGELLPPVENSCFIKDQERGDLKKLKSYAADGVSNPQFAVSSYANAYHCGTDTTKVYESWYR